MDIHHYFLKVNPPETIAYRKHSVTLKVIAKVQAQRRLEGKPASKNLLADVIIYKHFIP